jgi:hypothetical protein
MKRLLFLTNVFANAVKQPPWHKNDRCEVSTMEAPLIGLFWQSRYFLILIPIFAILIAKIGINKKYFYLAKRHGPKVSF